MAFERPDRPLNAPRNSQASWRISAIVKSGIVFLLIATAFLPFHVTYARDVVGRGGMEERSGCIRENVIPERENGSTELPASGRPASLLRKEAGF